MRRSIVTVSIVIGGLVAALDLGYHLGRQGVFPVAESQAGGGDEVILTASNTQNEVFCFVYNKTKNLIVSYMQRQTGGIELKGIRSTINDFPQINEYPSSQSVTAVKNMKKTVDQLKDKDKDKDKEKEKGK